MVVLNSICVGVNWHAIGDCDVMKSNIQMVGEFLGLVGQRGVVVESAHGGVGQAAFIDKRRIGRQIEISQPTALVADIGRGQDYVVGAGGRKAGCICPISVVVVDTIGVLQES